MTRVPATYVLYAYNEENYVREAVASAFAQDYEPLEIFLSDDGSTDRTFAIMGEMASEYRGPHQVLLNRNAQNRGIGSQLNAAVRRTTGELLVLANADDISRPHRVSALVSAWTAGGKRAAGVWSSLEIAEASGRPTGQIRRWGSDFPHFGKAVRSRFGGLGAAVLGLRRDCFDSFGPLADNLILEDGPLNLRATWLGGWEYVDEPLVLYRVHSENMSQAYDWADYDTWRRRHRARAIWQCSEGQKAFVQMLCDLYGDAPDPPPRDVLRDARVGAAARLLEKQLLESYYAGDWAPGLGVFFKEIGRLALLGVRVALKRLFPRIEARNDRWHYRRITRTSSASRTESGAKQ